MKPNIFKIATKELSQDGFFTWLLQWGAPENEKHNSALFNNAQNFIKLLLSKQNIENVEIKKVVAGRQWEKIDIWAEINNEYLIIIEDKTFTGEHSNQLEKYKKTATDWCKENNYKRLSSNINSIIFKLQKQLICVWRSKNCVEPLFNG